MKKIGIFTLLAVLGIGIGMSSAFGQLPVSFPAGINIKTIKGSGGFTPIGLPFTKQPVARAVIASSSGTTVTSVGSQFVSGAYTTASPHSVLFVTGLNAGVTITIASNTASTLTLSSNAPAGLVNNADELIVVPDWTLGNLFGTGTNPSGLASNLDPLDADIVYVGSGGSLVQYYHNGTNWRLTSGSPANANNLRVGGLNGGVVVLKRSGGDITDFQIKGILRSGKQAVSIAPNFNVKTYTEVTGATLGTSGLVPGVLASNSDPLLADIVYVPNASGALLQYFHNGSNWRLTAGSPANQNSLAIKADTALVINKRSSGTSTWSISEKFVP